MMGKTLAKKSKAVRPQEDGASPKASSALTPRKRYSLDQLLEGADSMVALNATTAWARDGNSVGREI